MKKLFVTFLLFLTAFGLSAQQLPQDPTIRKGKLKSEKKFVTLPQNTTKD